MRPRGTPNHENRVQKCVPASQNDRSGDTSPQCLSPACPASPADPANQQVSKSASKQGSKSTSQQVSQPPKRGQRQWARPLDTPRQARGLPLGVVTSRSDSSLILTRIPKGIPPHPGLQTIADDPPPIGLFWCVLSLVQPGAVLTSKVVPKIQGISGEALKSLKSGKGRPWDPPGKGPWKKEGPGLHSGPPQAC